MSKIVLVLCWLSSMVARSSNCYQCFIDADDSVRLCRGHILTEFNIRNVDSCFETIDRIFNTEKKVLDAAEVGRGYDSNLREILQAEIIPLADEFDQKTNNDTVYEKRLQTAAYNFITEASRLPRASGCFPPCGFQTLGAVYNCGTCQYDSCEFPLDCPTKEVIVGENNRTHMRCDVPFPLPSDIEVVWRYAETRTELMEQFVDVTAGVDQLFSIPSARLEQQGTYQCEIFSQERSLVRIFYYLTVVPQSVTGQAELQAVFAQALLPGGHVPLLTPDPPLALLYFPTSALVTVCLTALMLLLLISLG